MAVERTSQTADQPIQRKGQWRLTAMIILASAPLIVAMWMYFSGFGIPQSTTNKGDLLLPVITPEHSGIEFSADEEEQLLQAGGQRKWLLVVVAADSEVCDERCIESRYLARQVNVALGKEAARVGRVLVAENLHDWRVSEELQEKVADDRLLSKGGISQASLSTAVRQAGYSLQAWDILVMDPLGNIMMRYGEAHSGKDMLEDLKRLLKVSKIG